MFEKIQKFMKQADRKRHNVEYKFLRGKETYDEALYHIIRGAACRADRLWYFNTVTKATYQYSDRYTKILPETLRRISENQYEDPEQKEKDVMLVQTLYSTFAMDLSLKSDNVLDQDRQMVRNMNQLACVAQVAGKTMDQLFQDIRVRLESDIELQEEIRKLSRMVRVHDSSYLDENTNKAIESILQEVDGKEVLYYLDRCRLMWDLINEVIGRTGEDVDYFKENEEFEYFADCLTGEFSDLCKERYGHELYDYQFNMHDPRTGEMDFVELDDIFRKWNETDFTPYYKADPFGWMELRHRIHNCRVFGKIYSTEVLLKNQKHEDNRYFGEIFYKKDWDVLQEEEDAITAQLDLVMEKINKYQLRDQEAKAEELGLFDQLDQVIQKLRNVHQRQQEAIDAYNQRFPRPIPDPSRNY